MSFTIEIEQNRFDSVFGDTYKFSYDAFRYALTGQCSIPNLYF